MMTFTIAQAAGWLINPALAGFGAAAVSIPIVIHLLTRLRRQQVQWAAMRFLTLAFREQKQRLRLEQWLLLLVRCLILLLLGLALGQPLLEMWLAKLGGAGSGSGGRLVHLVMDDALSTQADEGGRARFERLRETALTITDQMKPTDRLALWRSARPVRSVMKPAAFDAATARQLLTTMKPRYSSSDLTAALSEIAKSAAEPQPPDRGRPVVVIVLSDFAATTLDLRPSPPKSVAQLADHAKIFVLPPAQSAANVQITSLTPRRRTLVVDAVAGRAVSVEIKLRRFADDRADPLTRLSVRLRDGEKVISEVKRDHRWSAGQGAATFQFDLPLDVVSASAISQEAIERNVTIEASIQNAGISGSASGGGSGGSGGISGGGSGGDAIEADNHRFSVVALRRRLMIAVVDDAAGLTGDESKSALRPRDWVAMALAPRTESPDVIEPASDSMELYALDATKIDSASLDTLDAAIVLRPDRLSEQGVKALKAFASRGGLVWLTAPNTDAPLTWVAPLLERFKLDWRVALEPTQTPQPGTALAAGGVVPEALNLLGADWESLLRPVRVYRSLKVTAAEGSDATWLSTADGSSLLLAGRHGEGWVLLLTVAMDDRWTNLPTKPLFVPLLHETLRSLIGQRGDDAVLAGQRPELGGRWANIKQLVRLRNDRSPRGTGINLIEEKGRRTTAKTLDEPGIYHTQPSGRQLAINVDAAGGDLRAIDGQQAATWLGAQLLNQQQPALALTTQQEQTNIGWQLLWCVAGLVLLETALARWFSHAAKMKGALAKPMRRAA